MTLVWPLRRPKRWLRATSLKQQRCPVVGKVADGRAVSRTQSTAKFPAGAEDLNLIVSIERFQDRTYETKPLDQCTQP